MLYLGDKQAGITVSLGILRAYLGEKNLRNFTGGISHAFQSPSSR